MKILAIVLAAAALTACSNPPSAGNDAPAGKVSGVEEATAGDNPADPVDRQEATAESPGNTDTIKTEADYLGRWTGVEGMYLVVAAKPDGGVTLEMQWDLGHKGTFDGSVTAEGLRFMRDGVAESAVHTDGDATGLKYLAGKADCLTVKPGEGYCRD